MRIISLYQNRRTFIHTGIDPVTKLIYLVCAMVIAFAASNWQTAAVLFLLQIVLLAWARELHRALATLTGSFVLLLSVFIIQGMFYPGNHTLLLRLGPIRFYAEGLRFAVMLAGRVVNIIAASSLFVLTTSPGAVMEAGVRRGLSAKLGYVVTSVLQMIPTMLASAVRIREAQMSRGMKLSGSLAARLRAFLPLFGPIVLSSFTSIQERAMALEVRGFSVPCKKTFYHEERAYRGMVWLRLALIAATAGLVVSSIWP